MNENAADNATDQPTTLHNWSNPDAAIFDTATLAVGAYIAPDAHFLSAGLKLDTDIF